MSTPSPAPAQPDDPASPASWERALLDRQLERLDQLADMGMALAGEIQRRAIASAPDTDSRSTVSASRPQSSPTPRTMRWASALCWSRVGGSFSHTTSQRTSPSPSSLSALAEAAFTGVLKSRTSLDCRARVMRTARDTRAKSMAAWLMEAEVTERLERDPIYADILTRPLSEIVADLCRDLGLSPDWSRLVQQDWAKEEIEDGKVGWPLTHLPRAAAGGGPSAERSEERMVEGAGQAHHASASPIRDSS